MILGGTAPPVTSIRTERLQAPRLLDRCLKARKRFSSEKILRDWLSAATLLNESDAMKNHFAGREFRDSFFSFWLSAYLQPSPPRLTIR